MKSHISPNTPPPACDEFEARHLRRWLAQQALLEQTLLRWVVQTVRRLDGLPPDAWEWVTAPQETKQQ